MPLHTPSALLTDQAPGNHEFWTGASPGAGTCVDPERYKRYFVVPTDPSHQEDYYSFDYGNSHFVVANANIAEGGGGDCKVTFKDFSIMAPDGDVRVTFTDFAVMASEWLACVR